jgi:hypothetical protein
VNAAGDESLKLGSHRERAGSAPMAWDSRRSSASVTGERLSTTIPAAAIAPPMTWSASIPGDRARRSPNTAAPRMTEETGSTVSMTGRLSESGPALKAL